MICINDIKEKYMPFIIGLTSCVLFFLFCRDAALYDLCRNWRETNRLLAAYDTDDRDGGESRPFAIGEKRTFPASWKSGLQFVRYSFCLYGKAERKKADTKVRLKVRTVISSVFSMSLTKPFRPCERS